MAVPLRSSAPSRRPLSAPKVPLRIVPKSRRAAGFLLTVAVLVAGAMGGALLLHTRISERQLEIDRLERSVRDAQEDFDLLRAQRAELRSPTQLASQALALGMLPGDESSFVAVDPMVLAITIARTGEAPGAAAGDGFADSLEPLDQFRIVKSLSAESP